MMLIGVSLCLCSMGWERKHACQKSFAWTWTTDHFSRAYYATSGGSHLRRYQSDPDGGGTGTPSSRRHRSPRRSLSVQTSLPLLLPTTSPIVSPIRTGGLSSSPTASPLHGGQLSAGAGGAAAAGASGGDGQPVRGAFFGSSITVTSGGSCISPSGRVVIGGGIGSLESDHHHPPLSPSATRPRQHAAQLHSRSVPFARGIVGIEPLGTRPVRPSQYHFDPMSEQQHMLLQSQIEQLQQLQAQTATPPWHLQTQMARPVQQIRLLSQPVGLVITTDFAYFSQR